MVIRITEPINKITVESQLGGKINSINIIRFVRYLIKMLNNKVLNIYLVS